MRQLLVGGERACSDVLVADTTTSKGVVVLPFCTARIPPFVSVPAQLPNPSGPTITSNTLTSSTSPGPGWVNVVSFVTKNRGGLLELAHNATDT